MGQRVDQEQQRDVRRADVRNLASRFYIITAEEDPALRQLARQSGADGYLTKPLQPDALLGLLSTAA